MWAQVAVLVAVLGPLIIVGTDSGIVRYLPGTDRTERTRSFVGWMLEPSDDPDAAHVGGHDEEHGGDDAAEALEVPVTTAPEGSVD